MKRTKIFQGLFLLLLSIISLSNQAQNVDRWKAGSAVDLTGNVLVLVSYISTTDDSWDKDEKHETLNKISEAESWLETQAEFFNKGINFKHVLLNDGNDIVFDIIEQGKGSNLERIDWVSRILKKSGYKNAKQAYRKIKKKYNIENIVVLIMAKECGRSYAMRYSKGLNKKKYFMEGAIIYNKYCNDAPMPVSAIIAHELLHIYGAWDLYKTYAQTADRQQKAQKFYPNDIMLRVDHNINTLSISNLTAWLIGWNKNEEDIFEWFRPSDYR